MQWAPCQPPAPVSPGSRRGWRQWRSAGKGSRSQDTRLGPSHPHLPPVPPCCQHCTSGEFISSCLEDISCLNQNCLLGRVLCCLMSFWWEFCPCNVKSVISVIYSSFCLWYPALEVTFFFHSSVAHPVVAMIHPSVSMWWENRICNWSFTGLCSCMSFIQTWKLQISKL